MKLNIISSSPLQTQQLAAEILSKIKNKNIICLYGDLGTGKTTFVQGLAKGLGIEKRVISPTFILIKEYEIAASSKRKVASDKQQVTRKTYYLKLATCNLKRLIHIDCYRINSAEDIKSVDLGEIWQDKDNLVVIEWAERIARILPKGRIDIKFEYISEKKRKISIATSSKRQAAGN